MKRTFFLLAFALGMPVVHACENGEVIVDLEKSLSRFWIELEKPWPVSQPTLLKIVHFPVAYSSPAKLEIVLELPPGLPPSDMTFRFNGGEKYWPIEDYSYHSGNHFDIFLPQLKTNQKTEFSFGWPGAQFDQARMHALLTTDSGQFFQQWTGENFDS
ncbi:MAG: hypothetical protein NXH95_11450 [Pseudomonadaceae bacterium]|nr:hypothetical protein [Pseudomonadaceae bacterium]